MTTRTFVAKPHHWQRNVDDSRATTARHAVLTDPDWTEHPAVLISGGPERFMLLTAEDALRLATEIADVLQTIRTHHNRKQEAA